MRSVLTIAILASAIISAPIAFASDGPVAGQELKQFVNGKRVLLMIPMVGEFPLYYQTNGKVSGDGTKTGLGRFFAPKETGTWFVDGANLCQQFPTWYKGKITCFTIQKTGETTLKWKRDDGYSGRARIEG